MIVVGYLYNKNGMATWCIEAALAIHSLGYEVILIKSSNTSLPDKFPVRYLDFDGGEIDYKNRTLFKKISDKAFKYIQLLPFIKRGDNFLPQLNLFLAERSIKPQCYLLNQTTLVNKVVPIPQYVVAWTYKPFLKDYLRKVALLSDNFKSFQANLYGAFFWHKVDWIGYRNATGVLAVSNNLKQLLSKQGIPAYTVYPGAAGGGLESCDPSGDNGVRPVKLALMALDIEDKRKGFKKIIDKLKELKPYSFSLTLIGNCSDGFKMWVLDNNFPATFTGLLPRNDAIEVLNVCDVLLFGSLVDDWGFVQVEAMSRGMSVLSPKSSPFDEIVGRDDYLYDTANEADLESKLKSIVYADTDTIAKDRSFFNHRYESMFSSKQFGDQLIKIITDK